MAAVDEQVPGRAARTEEGSPPPVVVFSTKVEVAEQDGRLRACDHQDHEHQKQEAEHVVHLTGPKRVQYEEQLNEDASERQHSAHHDAGHGLGVQGLFWNLTRDLVRAHWVVQNSLPKSEVSADKGERYRDSEPQSE